MNITNIRQLIKQHIWGPVGSVLFHVLIVAMLLMFAVAPPMEPPPDFGDVLITEEVKPDVLEKVLTTEFEKIKPPEQTFTDTVRPDVPVDMGNNVADTSGTTSGAGDAAGPGIGSGETTLPSGFEVQMNKSPAIMNHLYSARTASGRTGALSAFKGSIKGEDAVMRALRWFKANQGDDGAWSQKDAHPLAFAGLTLLAFLAHGETTGSLEFGPTVEKALKYVVSKQRANGAFSENSYEHAICTYAISEGYGLTKIMALKEAMDKAIDIIIEGQQSGGGYDYSYAKNARWDLSVAGWQFQALKAAKMAGCSNPKLENAIKKGTDFLMNVAYDPNAGGFGYASPSSTPSMSSAGTLCLQLMGKPNAPQVRSALKFLEDLPCMWAGGSGEKGKGKPEPDMKGAKQPVYTWYYATQAKFQKNGKDWDSWNPRFTKALVQNQIVEGPLGHWEGGDHGGAVYTTALCCLMLEVYYRYLPTYNYVEREKEPPVAAKSDDLVVDVG